MNNNNKYNKDSFETSLIAGLKSEQINIQSMDTPFYPLAFHAEMPEDVGFDNGHLSFRFIDFTINNLDEAYVTSKFTSDNEIKVDIKLSDAALNGTYEINSKHVQKVTLDTGGNMRELNETHAKAAGAADSGIDPLTQSEIDSMVTQARDQKKPIQATTHGPNLMSTYNTHNESYNTAFATSAILRELWADGGATTQLSRDTHSALNDGTVVNSPTKIYANGQTYNLSAASQKTNISVALAMMAFKAKEEGNSALEAKYTAAAKASATFALNVNDTGADKTEPANLTGKEVYAKLDDSNLKLREMSDEQFKNMFDQAYDEDSKDGGADEEALKNGWRILRNEERQMIREKMFIFQEEMNVIDDNEPELLWAGNCNANLGGTESSITLSYDDQMSAWKVTDSKVILPGFALDLDDSSWSGKTAEIVRERLANIHFVKSLLKNKIQASIRGIIEKVAMQSINIV